MYDDSFNRIIVDCGVLENNFRFIRKKAGSDVMAMVKADGYGHGMIKAAEAFARGGCRLFGVAELREAVLLRQAGIDGDIYVTIGFAPEDVEAIFHYKLTPVVYSFEAAQALSQKAVELGVTVGVHIKVDSGMSRLGILPVDLSAFVDRLNSLPMLKISGMMSHFAESDNVSSPGTEESFSRFVEAVTSLGEHMSPIQHIANSGAVLNFPGTACDMVRAGIALYGYHPGGGAAARQLEGRGLQPAMSFVSRVLQVKTLPAGTGVSYGHTYYTKLHSGGQQTRLATLPVGYEDGFSRALSNKGEVLIHGQRAPVRGRVCMNMCMVDVTEIPEVKAGDEVVLLGRQGSETITADDIAAGIDTISYEILCLLGNNNQRQYIE